MYFNLNSAIMSSERSITSKITFIFVGGSVIGGRYPTQAFVFSAWYIRFRKPYFKKVSSENRSWQLHIEIKSSQNFLQLTFQVW